MRTQLRALIRQRARISKSVKTILMALRDSSKAMASSVFDASSARTRLIEQAQGTQPQQGSAGVLIIDKYQLTAKQLMRLALEIPVDWSAQRKLLGFTHDKRVPSRP